MSDQENIMDTEFAAIRTIVETLDPLEPDSRQRVFEYVTAHLKISTSAAAPHDSALERVKKDENDREPDMDSTPRTTFDTFAELFDAAQPTSNANRALVSGYWIQVCDGADRFGGQLVNKALKDLGYGISNITAAIDILKQKKPALVLQLKKAGKSQQARKTYKVTEAGIKAVEAMISG